MKEPAEEEHPQPLRSRDERVAGREAAAGAEDAGPLPANQVGDRAGDQAAHQHAKCGYANWKVKIRLNMKTKVLLVISCLRDSKRVKRSSKYNYKKKNHL